MIKFLIAFAIAFSAIAATKIKDNTLKVGKEDGQDVYIYANEGSANSPFLVFDVAEGKWKQSNDGINIIDIGSGSDNFVDLTNNQTITGIKTFNAQTIVKDSAIPVSLLYKIISNDELTNYFSVDSNGLNTDLNFAMNGTGAIKVPVGDTSERPTPAQGMLRYNTEEESFEGYNGSEWGALGAGGGGSAGINFVFDPSFEKGDLNPDTDASAVESYQAYTADDKLYAEFNEQYYRAAYTGLTANNTYVRDTFARTDLDGKQGLFSIWIKANAENFELCLRTDDSGFASTCDDAYKLNILGDNTWRKYEIPFVYGAASVEYEIKNASYTGDVTIELDNIYVGTMPDGYISKIDTTITDWKEYTPTYGLTNVNTVIARYRRVGDSLEGQVTMQFSGTPTGSFLTVSLPTGLKIDNTKVATGSSVAVGAASGLDAGVAWFGGYVTASTQTTVLGVVKDNTATFRFNRISPTLPVTFVAGDDITYHFKVPIEGWSSEKSTVVTQDTELTAKTANEFSWQGSSTAVVSKENYDVINGNGSIVSTGRFFYTFNSNIFTDAPNCTCSAGPLGGTTQDWTCSVNTINSGGLTVNITNNGVATSTNHTIFCSKQGADVNKSQTIVGKFENINSSDLCHVEARNVSSATSIAAGLPIPFVEVKDNCNTWDGDEFRPTKTGWYKVRGSVRASTAVLQYMDSRINNVDKNLITTDPIASSYVNFGDLVYLTVGDVYHVMSEYTFTTVINSARTHWISIQEMPDYEAIVKNLSDQKVKCQTKYLSADVLSTGIFMTFSNLVIGKRYSFDYKFKCSEANATADQFIGCRITIEHGGSVLQEANGYNQFTSAIQTNFRYDLTGMYKFVATNTTLDVKAASLVNTLVNGIIPNGSEQLTLCELPDTYVETTQF